MRISPMSPLCINKLFIYKNLHICKDWSLTSLGDHDLYFNTLIVKRKVESDENLEAMFFCCITGKEMTF